MCIRHQCPEAPTNHTVVAAAPARKRLLTLRGRLAWAHDWVSDPTLTPVFQTLPGASFIVNGATPAKNSALASAGAEMRYANGVSFIAKFDGEFAGHSNTYVGSGTVRYTLVRSPQRHGVMTHRIQPRRGKSASGLGCAKTR